MNALRKVSVFVVLFVLLLLPVQVAEAQAPVSTPDSPMALSADWVELSPDATHIYKFKYNATEDKFGSGGRSPMEIKFYVTPSGAARLTLRNAEQIRKWANEGKNEWFGVAMPQNLSFKANCDSFNKAGAGGDYDHECHDASGNRIWYASEYANWSATLGATGNSWVVVQPTRGQTGPIAYKIVVSGPGFQFVGGNP